MQTKSLREQLAIQRWYDPNAMMMVAFAMNSPAYRESSNKPAINSCGHMLHYRCMTALYNSYQNNSAMSRMYSIFCPVCRRLENDLVPILTHLLFNAHWRDQLIFTPSWTPECQGKYELQACLQCVVEREVCTDWWIAESMAELYEDAIRENGNQLKSAIELFKITSDNQMKVRMIMIMTMIMMSID